MDEEQLDPILSVEEEEETAPEIGDESEDEAI